MDTATNKPVLLVTPHSNGTGIVIGEASDWDGVSELLVGHALDKYRTDPRVFGKWNNYTHRAVLCCICLANEYDLDAMPALTSHNSREDDFKKTGPSFVVDFN